MTLSEQTNEKISSANDIAKIINALLDARPADEKHKEYFYSLGLDSQNRVLYVCLEAFGTINSCVPYIREILRNAIIKNAVSIIIAHNHPGGETIPSAEDSNFTRRLKEACGIMQCNLLDHIIVGNGFYSYGDAGKL